MAFQNAVSLPSWLSPSHFTSSRCDFLRTPKQLLIASKHFAAEKRWLSWWHLWSTAFVLLAALAVAVSGLPWWLRLGGSLLAGLIGVRLFIIYHDFQHSAILRNSLLARVLLDGYGLLTLNPPSVWNASHDHHHKHNSKTFEPNIGSYPIMTLDGYKSASFRQRLVYHIARHPITMLLGYFSVFFWRMSLRPFLLNPRQHFDGGAAIAINLMLVVSIWWFFGFATLAFGMLIPLSVASALGAYLFYAQHNYPTAKMCAASEWSHVEAALHSSSFMEMNPVMNWFTGNIGYHHVHHLNARIPFYRLPEAMRGLPELQSPGRTSLRPNDIVACLRLKLWCNTRQRFVSFSGR